MQREVPMTSSAIRISSGAKGVRALSSTRDGLSKSMAARDERLAEARDAKAGFVDTLDAMGALLALLLKGHDGRHF